MLSQHDEGDIEYAPYTQTEVKPNKREPILVTKVTSHSGPLNKNFSLEGGKIIKTASAQMVEGTAEIAELDNITGLARLIEGLKPNQALVLGVTDLAQCKLTVRSKVTPERRASGYRSRTKEDFAQPERGVLLIDYDQGEHLPYHMQCNTPEDLMAKLAVIPELAGVQYMGATSSSAGITITETGEAYAAHGLHIYIETATGFDLDAFRQWLEVALWRAGLGYISFARNGAMLVRFIIDISVLHPERLVFEAAPTLAPGLHQTPREFEAEPGSKLLGTAFAVTQQEIDEYHADVERQKRVGSVIAKAAKIRETYIKERGDVMARSRNIDPVKAQGLVRAALEKFDKTQVLDADFLLDMGTHYVTVGELLERANEYDRRAMPDPFEGREYGDTTAKFWFNEGEPIIHSYAHGVRTIYKLAMPVPPSEPPDRAPPVHAPVGLSKFSLNGSSAALAGRLAEEAYLIEGISLLGQCTAIYAPPNVGKSLIALKEIAAAVQRHPHLRGNVHYANADDTAAGIYEKLLIAEEAGFNMLAPGENGFEIGDFLQHLVDMCDRDAVAGQVVILDTLKKFTDLMSKTTCAAFGKVVRRFVQKGGTMLLLGHANKRLGPDGKPVPEGTSDIINDADCAYRMFEVERDDEAQEKIVRLERIKARGNVTEAAHYRYSTARSVSYRDLLDSVERLADSYVPADAGAPTYDESVTVAAVIAAINSGINAKLQLRDEVAMRCNISKRQALIVIDRYTGTDTTQHRWSFTRVEHGRFKYTVLQ